MQVLPLSLTQLIHFTNSWNLSFVSLAFCWAARWISIAHFLNSALLCPPCALGTTVQPWPRLRNFSGWRTTCWRRACCMQNSHTHPPSPFSLKKSFFQYSPLPVTSPHSPTPGLLLPKSQRNTNMHFLHGNLALSNRNTYSVQKHGSKHMLKIYRENKAILVFKSSAKERHMFYNLG